MFPFFSLCSAATSKVGPIFVFSEIVELTIKLISVRAEKVLVDEADGRCKNISNDAFFLRHCPIIQRFQLIVHRGKIFYPLNFTKLSRKKDCIAYHLLNIFNLFFFNSISILIKLGVEDSLKEKTYLINMFSEKLEYQSRLKRNSCIVNYKGFRLLGPGRGRNVVSFFTLFVIRLDPSAHTLHVPAFVTAGGHVKYSWTGDLLMWLFLCYLCQIFGIGD